MTDIAYQNKHMFATPTGWLRGKLIPSGRDGYQRLQLPSGEIFSMQPGGTYGSRPPGTDGPWEQLKVTASVMAFTPNDEAYGIVFMAV